MTKREAMKNVCEALVELLDSTHENGFLYADQKGKEYPEADSDRMREALQKIVDGLARRAQGKR